MIVPLSPWIWVEFQIGCRKGSTGTFLSLGYGEQPREDVLKEAVRDCRGGSQDKTTLTVLAQDPVQFPHLHGGS